MASLLGIDSGHEPGFGQEDEDGIHWDDRKEVFVSHSWRRLLGVQAPLVQEFILEFFNTCRIRDEIALDVAGTLCFQLGGARRSMNWRQFTLALGLYNVEEMAKDGFGTYWHTEERKSSAMLLGGQFIGRLDHHFGLVSNDGLRGLSVVARELLLIDMVAATGSPEAAEDAPVVDEGAQADPAPMQVPQPPLPPSAAGKTMP
uniref:Uncharacterized protein n=1 Tax=Tanacetum cinerariifolium TaxID=118510 RepID=A0A6L2K675_TANCI|nr:hypothetical protein [Tanacetum cinerariifolium]